MENMMKTYYKRRLHDRDDGWRVRDIDNVYTIVPYVLRTRIDSQCFFEEEIDVDRVEAFIRAHKQDIPNLTIMHIVIAAMVRIMSQRPYINRYIVYNKLYAHNCIQISLCIKRSLTDRGVETVIKPVFEPTDTLTDVVDKINALVAENMEDTAENSSDSTASTLGKLPSWALRIIVQGMRALDSIGLLPKSCAPPARGTPAPLSPTSARWASAPSTTTCMNSAPAPSLSPWAARKGAPSPMKRAILLRRATSACGTSSTSASATATITPFRCASCGA